MKSLLAQLPVLLLSLAVAGAVQSVARQSFEQLKAQAARWESTLQEQPLRGQMTLRVTVLGDKLSGEVKFADRLGGLGASSGALLRKMVWNTEGFRDAHGH